jgi:hypothetical protein
MPTATPAHGYSSAHPSRAHNGSQQGQGSCEVAARPRPLQWVPQVPAVSAAVYASWETGQGARRQRLVWRVSAIRSIICIMLTCACASEEAEPSASCGVGLPFPVGKGAHNRIATRGTGLALAGVLRRGPGPASSFQEPCEGCPRYGRRPAQAGPTQRRLARRRAGGWRATQCTTRRRLHRKGRRPLLPTV